MVSLRLVSDGFVQEGNSEKIAAEARAFADKVESGELEAERVILVCVIDGLLDLTVFGPSPTIADGIGMLELAKAKIIAGSWA
jgi:hypothetical protein